MKRFLFFIFMIMFCVNASAEDMSLEKKLEEALNNFKTAHGMFKQYDVNGEISTGEFWISKPGKMRFEYAYPNDNVILSDGSLLFYWDEAVQQQNHIPLSYTPAGLILGEKITLSEDEIVVQNIREDSGQLYAEMYSAEDEDIGSISIMFDKKGKSYLLKQWKIEDASGGSTIVSLMDVEYGVKIEDDKFKYKDPNKDPFKLN